MTAEFPEVGQVFDYHYLWKWQALRGETEGRKKRPSCVSVVTTVADGQRVIFIAPITSKSPESDRSAIEVPKIEAHRAGLETDIPLWIVVDELNADYPDLSYVIEDRAPRGSFSPAFMDRVVDAIHKLRQQSKLAVSSRRSE